MEKSRRTEFDLLRIIAMIFVVGLHGNYQGHLLEMYSFYDFNEHIIQLFEAVFYTANDIFVLISGYFLIDKKKINKHRVITLISSVWFYSWIFLFLSLVLGVPSIFKLQTVLMSIFPIITGQYWFITEYLILLLFSPILNSFVKKNSRRTFNNTIVGLLLLFCIIPTLFPFASENYFKMDGGANIVWFVTIYFTGAWLRINHIWLNKHSSKCFLLSFVLSILVLYLSYVILSIVGIQWLGNASHVNWLYHNNSIFVFSAASSLFCLFTKIKINYKFNKIVTLFSAHAFGVYLIHQNIFVKSFLWDSVFDDMLNFFPTIPGIVLLICCILIFVGAACVDILREHIFTVIELKLRKYQRKV